MYSQYNIKVWDLLILWAVAVADWIIWISIWARPWWGIFLLVFENGLSCFTHLFYLVILLCLTQPITVFVTLISFFRASISWFGAEMVDFNSCTSSLSLLFSSTSNIFSIDDFASRFSNFGPIWVFVCCNPRICADNSLAFLEVCKFVLI